MIHSTAPPSLPPPSFLFSFLLFRNQSASPSRQIERIFFIFPFLEEGKKEREEVLVLQRDFFPPSLFSLSSRHNNKQDGKGRRRHSLPLPHPPRE